MASVRIGGRHATRATRPFDHRKPFLCDTEGRSARHRDDSSVVGWNATEPNRAKRTRERIGSATRRRAFLSPPDRPPMSPAGEQGTGVTAIRAMGAADLLGLLRMRRGGARLNLPDALVSRYTPLTGIARGRWNPLRSGRVRTYIAAEGRTPRAFIQVRERLGEQRHKWDVLYLGTTRKPRADYSAQRGDFWVALLDHTTAVAGRRGVQRLFARVAGGGEAAAAFHTAGYNRFSEETIYTLLAPVALPPAPDHLPLRKQEPGDTWALHQLYTLTAPKGVQYAEAHTSHHWEVPHSRSAAMRGGTREWGFVAERGHELAIYCRVARRGGRSRLEFLYEPAARELLVPTLTAMLRWLAPVPGERIYCTVRDYQAELGSALRDLGFTFLEVQGVLVRYTVVTARAPVAVSRERAARERRLVGVPAGSLRWHGSATGDGARGSIVKDRTR
jgi:hypothetical protein